MNREFYYYKHFFDDDDSENSIMFPVGDKVRIIRMNDSVYMPKHYVVSAFDDGDFKLFDIKPNRLLVQKCLKYIFGGIK